MSDLSDRQMSVTHAASILFWIGGLLLIVANMIGRAPTGDLGVYVTAIGAVTTVRGYFASNCAMVRNAFELGRDAGVRNIRR